MAPHRKTGFTLIELSIVLVIIGLIIGGILVGRDLLLQATIRKSIKEIEQFTQAFNTFQLKYDCTPGDCPNATAFGFSFNGNGNGRILDIISCCSPVYSDEEINVITHLQNANLIGQATTIWGANGWRFPGIAYSNASQYFFRTDPNTNRNTIWIIAAAGSPGYPSPGLPPGCPNNSNGYYGGYYCPGETAFKSYLIDVKIDDGLPNSGLVYEQGTQTYPAYPGVLWAGTGGATANVCQDTSVSPPAYNISNDVSRTCALGVLMETRQ